MAANITVHSIDYFSWQITIYRLRVRWLLRLYLEDSDLECDTKLHFRIKKKAHKVFQVRLFILALVERCMKQLFFFVCSLGTLDLLRPNSNIFIF